MCRAFFPLNVPTLLARSQMRFRNLILPSANLLTEGFMASRHHLLCFSSLQEGPRKQCLSCGLSVCFPCSGGRESAVGRPALTGSSLLAGLRVDRTELTGMDHLLSFYLSLLARPTVTTPALVSLSYPCGNKSAHLLGSPCPYKASLCPCYS